MSALSDYIHFYYIHYLNYGITRKNISGQGVPNYSIKTIKNRIKNNVKPISSNAITTLEERLKANSYREYQQSIGKIQQKKQKFIDLIYQELIKKSQQVTGIQRIDSVAKGGMIQYTNKNAPGGKELVNLQGQAWASSLSYQQLLTKRQQAAKMYQTIKRLINEINAEGLQNDQKFLQLVDLVNQYCNLTMDPTKHTLGEIQSVLQQYNYKGALTDISGGFLEDMISVCDDTCYNLAETATDEEVQKAVTQAITKNVVGGQRTRAVMNKSLVGVGYGLTRRSANNRNEYFLGTTQNKVDVKISIGGESLLASGKSSESLYSKRPHLQDVDLYPTLTFLNSQVAGLENFGTHWLNMHCISLAAESGLGAPSGRDNLDNILKMEVAYEALSSGNPFKQGVDSANVFVYINRSTGKVYVKSVQQLLITDNMDRIGGLNRISTLRYKQKWQPEIWQRLNDILRQVHKTKLSIALNVKYD